MFSSNTNPYIANAREHVHRWVLLPFFYPEVGRVEVQLEFWNVVLGWDHEAILNATIM